MLLSLNDLEGFLMSDNSENNRDCYVMRSPRVSGYSISDTVFKSSHGDLFSLVNISTGGMAIVRSDDLPDWKLGDIASGEIVLGGENSHKVDFLIRHVGDSVVGCEFVGAYDELSLAICDFYEAEILGQQVRFIERVNDEQEQVEELHYSDGFNIDCEIRLIQSKLDEVSLAYWGNFLVIDAQNIRLGYYLDQQEHAIQYGGPRLIQFNDELDEQMISVGIKVLDHINDLNKSIVRQAKLFVKLYLEAAAK